MTLGNECKMFLYKVGTTCPTMHYIPEDWNPPGKECCYIITIHYFLCENNLFLGIPYATNCGMNFKMMFSFW
jgi:hypothetical protein